MTNRVTNYVSVARSILAVARPHHWAKNLLIFVPIVLAHRWADGSTWRSAALCFLGFSLLASSVYVLNDILDAEADRKHKSKRSRPVAAGIINPSSAGIISVIFLAASVVMMSLLPTEAQVVTAMYVVGAAAYSAWLKSVAVLDVLALGAFYVLRVIAGGTATGIVISPWTLAFSMFLFISLALAKRYVEVHRHGASDRRGYRQEDSAVLLVLGIGTGLISVQVLALYISGPEVTKLYSRPELLWLMCPVLLGWIARVWLIAGRGELHDDPLVFALKDPGSYATAACAGIILLSATFGQAG